MLSDKRKLYLITDGFPYGIGESFIMTELRYLCQWYDITIIPRHAVTGKIRELPEEVKLLDVARPARLSEKVRFVFSFLFGKYGRQEIKAIWNSGQNRLLRLKKSLLSYASAELFWTVIKEKGVVNEPDGTVYYSFWYTPAAVALSFHRNELPGAKVIVRTHGYDLYNERATAGRQPFKPTADDGMDRIIFCCQFGKDYYLDAFRVNDCEKYVHIGLGTNNSTDLNVSPKSEPFQLVSCSMAVPGKRVERIIQALSLITEFPIVWTHIGGGPCLDDLKELAEKCLGAHENICYSFMGNMENDAVMKLYERGGWGSFITTSATEGSPVSIQEALSYGIPVIATAVGGIPEQLDKTDNILLSDDPTAEETATAIRKMYMLDNDQYQSLRKKNYDRWKEHYNAKKNACKLSDTINSLWFEK